jgi:hypothetical protein
LEDSRFGVSKDCVAEKLDGEIIILNLSTGMYHQLNAIGTILWEEIQKSNPSLQDLIADIKQQFGAADVDGDVREFVEDLLEREIIFKR